MERHWEKNIYKKKNKIHCISMGETDKQNCPLSHWFSESPTKCNEAALHVTD